MKKIFIKLVLLLLIVGFFGFNYKLLSVSGVAKTDSLFAQDQGLVDVIDTISDIEKVEYYQSDLIPTVFDVPEENTIMFVFYTEAEGVYLAAGTQQDVDSFQLLGAVVSSLEPEQTQPFAVAYYIVAIVIVVLLPLGGKKRKR